MLIILEGPEAAGKSTLAEQLSKQTGYPIVHRRQPKDEQEKAQMMSMYLDFIYNNKDVILDRCWYSEMVYGPVMRDKSFISVEQMYTLENEMLKHCTGVLVIHCTATVDKLWKRSQERGEDYITDLQTLGEVAYRFEHLMHGMKHLVPVVRYEYDESLS